MGKRRRRRVGVQTHPEWGRQVTLRIFHQFAEKPRGRRHQHGCCFCHRQGRGEGGPDHQGKSRQRSDGPCHRCFSSPGGEEMLTGPVNTLGTNGEVRHPSRLQSKERGREMRPLEKSHTKSSSWEGGVGPENWAKEVGGRELEVS